MHAKVKRLKNVKTLMSVHNLPSQGRFTTAWKQSLKTEPTGGAGGFYSCQTSRITISSNGIMEFLASNAKNLSFSFSQKVQNWQTQQWLNVLVWKLHGRGEGSAQHKWNFKISSIHIFSFDLEILFLRSLKTSPVGLIFCKVKRSESNLLSLVPEWNGVHIKPTVKPLENQSNVKVNDILEALVLKGSQSTDRGFQKLSKTDIYPLLFMQWLCLTKVNESGHIYQITECK